MTENEQKQQFSIAYLHAVAARAGFACQATLVDDDSVDATLAARGYVHRQAVLRSPRLEVQLKATAQQDLLRDTHLSFPLPIKNYDELRAPSMVPRLLVVLLLPATPTSWLEQSEAQMIVRHAAYWLPLLAAPDVSTSRTVTVQLPRTNVLTVQHLQGLMERAARRQAL
jgi:hypothetical protein